MKNSVFFNFLFLLLSKHKSKHIAIFLISILIVFLSASILFISTTLKKEIFSTLNNKEQALLIRPFANSKNPLAVLLFFIALHDLGKLTPGFQLKIPEWRQRLKSLEFNWSDELANQHQNTIHGFTGFFLLVKLLESCLNLHKEPARALANSVMEMLNGSLVRDNGKKHVPKLWSGSSCNWVFRGAIFRLIQLN